MILKIVRGLPGSGKSTFARKWAEENNAYHVEADMFFVDGNNHYHYDSSKIDQAHDWCQLTAAKALERGENVVVSNTFCRMWEIEPYVKMTEKLGAQLQFHECLENFGNIHNVPQASLEHMAARWEKLNEGW